MSRHWPDSFMHSKELKRQEKREREACDWNCLPDSLDSIFFTIFQILIVEQRSSIELCTQLFIVHRNILALFYLIKVNTTYSLDKTDGYYFILIIIT